MEIYIIIILICFIIILYFVDEIKLIYKINKINKINSVDKIQCAKTDEILLLYYNPILIKLYKNILDLLKKINKYDYKSYFCELSNNINIDLSIKDRLYLNWFNTTYGIIKLSQDTLLKIKNHIYLENLLNQINLVYNYYLLLEKSFKNIIISKNKKLINKKKYVKNEKINDKIIKLYKVEEVLRNLFNKNIKKSLLNSNKNIMNILKKEKYINLINFKLNTKLKLKKDIQICKKDILFNYFV
jgi:hypothetical protein